MTDVRPLREGPLTFRQFDGWLDGRLTEDVTYELVDHDSFDVRLLVPAAKRRSNAEIAALLRKIADQLEIDA
ncbi:MAG: hypothetical protein E5X53_30825 [Mesorhizobium sp.]|uniref:hypothetical protein n=1 Tax=Mesorhizobium sp. TaxID=1871066 RepID=UPI00120675BF|nr:hypothetical protein [Mesorhizobium sp.]TIP69776.1 MAG: hypothetical protein E5X55_30600 [Mesorhizobium sp.]TIQ04349.1 MAG: hypothetical protein E5X57_29505 [Mesorhizobium sp.]TIR48153.1 MAG: hypothetical protein E5X53_30825 [Mesorhizobium sp.]TJV94557.1 MAG: hypothetical protein E5X52_28495 [Mesorhizobium sp.]